MTLAPGPNGHGVATIGGEVCHLVTELGRIAPALNLYLARDRAELINVAWTNFLFNGEKLEIKLFLISLRQEGDEELASLEHLRAKHSVKEALIVLLALGKLAWERLLGFGCR